MDPNENLRLQRDIVADLLAGKGIDQNLAVDLAELTRAMDEWLSKGGFLPDDWRPRPLERLEEG